MNQQIEQQVVPVEQQQIERTQDVPRENVPLPSNGLIYPKGYFLADKDSVDIRAMTIRDEDLLSSEPLIRSRRAIDEFVKSALGGAVDTNIMCHGDRDAIMFAFRATGYGTDYKVQVTCPACNETVEYEFDLSKLQIIRLEGKPMAPNTNVFEMPGTLPVSGAPVTFAVMTVGAEKEVVKKLEALAKRAQTKVLPEISLRLFEQIHTVDNLNKEKDAAKIRTFVDSMHAADSRYLRKHINQISPKLNTKQEMTCSRCGTASNVTLPVELSFFFPDV